MLFIFTQLLLISSVGANALFCFNCVCRFGLILQKRLLSCYCVVTIVKRVNEGTFPCCWPVVKLTCRLTAFSMCFTVAFRCVWARKCAFVCMSGAKETFPPGASDSSLTFSSSFHCSRSSFCPIWRSTVPPPLQTETLTSKNILDGNYLFIKGLFLLYNPSSVLKEKRCSFKMIHIVRPDR